MTDFKFGFRDNFISYLSYEICFPAFKRLILQVIFTLLFFTIGSFFFTIKLCFVTLNLDTDVVPGNNLFMFCLIFSTVSFGVYLYDILLDDNNIELGF
jgi:hypothetical protein